MLLFTKHKAHSSN